MRAEGARQPEGVKGRGGKKVESLDLKKKKLYKGSRLTSCSSQLRAAS